MQHPGAVPWLCEVNEIFHSEVHHLLDLLLVSLQDVLQQAVDLQDLQAALGCPAAHFDPPEILFRREKWDFMRELQ